MTRTLLQRPAQTERAKLDTVETRALVGYGLVCDIDGKPWPDLIVDDASQEHGIITVRPGIGAALPALAIGDRVRILPNHACATGAQHDAYQAVETGSCDVVGTWPRMRGW